MGCNIARSRPLRDLGSLVGTHILSNRVENASIYPIRPYFRPNFKMCALQCNGDEEEWRGWKEREGVRVRREVQCNLHWRRKEGGKSKRLQGRAKVISRNN